METPNGGYRSCRMWRLGFGANGSTALIAGSRACGVTPTATFGDGAAIAVVVWHDCVRAFESGGLPTCTTIAGRARSAAEAMDLGAGRAAHRRRQWAGCIL